MKSLLGHLSEQFKRSSVVKLCVSFQEKNHRKHFEQLWQISC